MNGRDLRGKTIQVRLSELERAEAELLAMYERRSVSAMVRDDLLDRVGRFARTHPQFATDLSRVRNNKDPLAAVQALLLNPHRRK